MLPFKNIFSSPFHFWAFLFWTFLSFPPVLILLLFPILLPFVFRLFQFFICLPSSLATLFSSLPFFYCSPPFRCLYFSRFWGAFFFLHHRQKPSFEPLALRVVFDRKSDEPSAVTDGSSLFLSKHWKRICTCIWVQTFLGVSIRDNIVIGYDELVEGAYRFLS